MTNKEKEYEKIHLILGRISRSIENNEEEKFYKFLLYALQYLPEDIYTAIKQKGSLPKKFLTSPGIIEKYNISQIKGIQIEEHPEIPEGHLIMVW